MNDLAIEAEALVRRFGDRTAVDALNLSVPRGSVLGFLGPNGAGKTTTVRMLGALIAPTSGKARVNGHDVTTAQDKVRRSVGILTETPGLYERLPALGNLTLYAELHGMRGRAAKDRAKHYLGLVGLADRGHELAGGFSKGMKQRLAIARALLHEPEVVFLDEPTSGLDPEAARTVRDLVLDLKKAGRTIVLATHNLVEAELLSDQVAVFDTRLLAIGTTRELRARMAGQGTRITLAHPERDGARAIEIAGLARSRRSDRFLDVDLADAASENAALIAGLVSAGIEVTWVEARSATLEAVYLDLVGRKK